MNGLDYLIKTNNISQQEIANITGVLKQQVNYWIKGKRKINDDKANIIATKFNVTKEYVQNKVSDEEIIRYYKSIIENEIGKEVEVSIANN